MSGATLVMDMAIAADAALAGQARRVIEHVSVAGREVRVDVYGSGSAAPVVLLLHGTGGLLGDGGLMRRAAREFAAEGFRARVVHYFNVTGTMFATQANIREHEAEWIAAIEEICRHYAESSGTEMGIFGYSLGGILAASAAARVDGIAALAVMGAGLPPEHAEMNAGALPPLLILHGEADSKVPPARAEALARLAWHANGFVDTVMYPGEGHAFGARVEKDSLRRASDFFHTRVGAGVSR